MNELLDEIHPGEILLRDFMKPMGISARQLAADIDVSPSRISNLVNGNRPITADTALRLGLFFNMAPRFWMNLQTEYDMRVAARTLTNKIAPRIRVFQTSVLVPQVGGWLNKKILLALTHGPCHGLNQRFGQNFNTVLCQVMMAG